MGQEEGNQIASPRSPSPVGLATGLSDDKVPVTLGRRKQSDGHSAAWRLVAYQPAPRTTMLKIFAANRPEPAGGSFVNQTSR